MSETNGDANKILSMFETCPSSWEMALAASLVHCANNGDRR